MKRRLIPATALILGAIAAGPTAAQTWTELTPVSGPAPTPRTLTAAIYDPVGHRMIVFGGEDASTRFNEVWSFDLAANMWTDVTPASGSAPAGRITPGSVYDAQNHMMLTWSGQGAGNAFFNDTWTFDLNAHTWSEFTPPNPLPAIRYGVGTVYDPVGRRQVTFAGFTNQGRFDDTWQ
ncbi:MAG: kelch repeat-containing protein, partial [Rubricoccaceae bacterium]|nr:kelch repeat-containing protein [Rubricoccaceae bacterium]